MLFSVRQVIFDPLKPVLLMNPCMETFRKLHKAENGSDKKNKLRNHRQKQANDGEQQKQRSQREPDSFFDGFFKHPLPTLQGEPLKEVYSFFSECGKKPHLRRCGLSTGFQPLEKAGSAESPTLRACFQGLPFHFVSLLVASRQPLSTSSRVETMGTCRRNRGRSLGRART